MSEFKISGCIDCPMFFSDVDDWFFGGETKCLHPNAQPQSVVESIDLDIEKKPITPEWCPLKKEPITISYE